MIDANGDIPATLEAHRPYPIFSLTVANRRAGQSRASSARPRSGAPLTGRSSAPVIFQCKGTTCKAQALQRKRRRSVVGASKLKRGHHEINAHWRAHHRGGCAWVPYWDSQNNTIIKVPGVTIKKS
jgi:hypothetical protein